MIQEPHKVSRVEAANRQLEATIALWLSGGEVLAVHTLAMATEQLIRDLVKYEKSDLHDHLLSTGALDSMRQVQAIARKLKHADRDPSDSVEIPDDNFNKAILAACCAMLIGIGAELSVHARAFHKIYFMTEIYPDVYARISNIDGYDNDEDMRAMVKILIGMPKLLK